MGKEERAEPLDSPFLEKEKGWARGPLGSWAQPTKLASPSQ